MNLILKTLFHKKKCFSLVLCKLQHNFCFLFLWSYTYFTFYWNFAWPPTQFPRILDLTKVSCLHYFLNAFPASPWTSDVCFSKWELYSIVFHSAHVITSHKFSLLNFVCGIYAFSIFLFYTKIPDCILI